MKVGHNTVVKNSVSKQSFFFWKMKSLHLYFKLELATQTFLPMKPKRLIKGDASFGSDNKIEQKEGNHFFSTTNKIYPKVVSTTC